MIAEARKTAHAVMPPQPQVVSTPPAIKPSAPISGTVKTSTPQIVYISVDQDKDYDSRASSPVKMKSRPASSRKSSSAASYKKSPKVRTHRRPIFRYFNLPKLENSIIFSCTFNGF